MYLIGKEEEFTNLLVELGTKRNVAQVMVFLANIPEATARDIQQGTDLRQPAISDAMRYLIQQNWVASRETKAESEGRSAKIYGLSRPFHEIIDCIEQEKKKEATDQIALVQKLQYHLR
ncbi:MAG: ArsR family transcriptional regulator [Methanoregula sp.]|jgi:predicted transcriptional regulator|nr:ArsR family transcriptional regulator [Methanoregula sp.]